MCDYPELFNITEPVARKDHWCCECHRRIERGTKYTRISGKWDGEMSSFGQCNQCATLSMMMSHDFGGDDGCGIYFGHLYETWNEHCMDLPMEVLALSPPTWLVRRAEAIEHWRKYYRYSGTAA